MYKSTARAKNDFDSVGFSASFGTSFVSVSLSSLLALSGPIMKGCCPVLGWEVRSLRTLPQQSQEAKPTADPKDAAQRAASCARARIGAQLCRPFDLCLNCIRMRRVSGIRDACPFP